MYVPGFQRTKPQLALLPLASSPRPASPAAFLHCVKACDRQFQLLDARIDKIALPARCSTSWPDPAVPRLSAHLPGVCWWRLVPGCSRASRLDRPYRWAGARQRCGRCCRSFPARRPALSLEAARTEWFPTTSPAGPAARGARRRNPPRPWPLKDEFNRSFLSDVGMRRSGLLMSAFDSRARSPALVYESEFNAWEGEGAK